MKFLIDMPLSPELAAWLREQGHDALHLADIGLARAADLDVLARAKADGRTIVTADLDYPRLLALLKMADPGLILFRDGNWSDASVITRMRAILHGLSAVDLSHHVVVVERDRVRRRRLPIDR